MLHSAGEATSLEEVTQLQQHDGPQIVRKKGRSNTEQLSNQ